jgi:tagatose 6-phosphate kinase
MLPHRASPYEFDVVIAAPNPAVDSYYSVGQLHVGEVNRAQEVLHTAGGKGNNMARAVVGLGGRALSLGIVGGMSGQFIVRELEREGIAYDMAWTEQETRRTSTVVALQHHQTTVVLENGPAVGEKMQQEFMSKVLTQAVRAPFLALTGSLPPGFPTYFYAELITAVKKHQIRVCVDASGAILQQATEAGVSIIKVNREEFCSAFARDSVWDWQAASSMFTRLQPRGLETLIVTHGADGAIIFTRDRQPFRVKTKVDRWVSTAGAGDSFLAGFLLALTRGESLETAACFASATAASNLQRAGCGFVIVSEVDAFLTQTTLENVDLKDIQP